jgi:uncharacterized membrane protein (GlpM family)
MVGKRNVVAGLIPAQPTFTSEKFIVTDLSKYAAFAEVIILVM